MAKTTERKIIEWMFGDNTGLSSETMAAYFLGIERRRKYHPSDPADFNRCLLFLKAVPEVRSRLGELKALSAAWDGLVTNWDELEECFISEVGADWSKTRQKATKTYDRMTTIFDAVGV